MSSSRIWTIADGEGQLARPSSCRAGRRCRRHRHRPSGGFRWSPSTPGTGRPRSGSGRATRTRSRSSARHARPAGPTMPRSNTGAVSPTIHAIIDQQREPHHQRQPDADLAAPSAAAASGSLFDRIEMKMRLSMPSTTSITIRVSERGPGGRIGEQFERSIHGAQLCRASQRVRKRRSCELCRKSRRISFARCPVLGYDRFRGAIGLVPGIPARFRPAPGFR